MATITSITVVAAEAEQTACDGCSVVLTGLFGYEVETDLFCAECVATVAPHKVAA